MGVGVGQSREGCNGEWRRGNELKRKIWGVLAWRSGTQGESATPATYQKGAILESWVGQAGTASSIREDGHVSSGVRICILSEDTTQASHLQGKYPLTGEAAVMMCADTKKDVHTSVEIPYN